MKSSSSPKISFSHLSKVAAVCGGLILSARGANAATLLDYWDFNNVSSQFSGSTLGHFATTNPGGGSAVNNGEIYSGGVLSSNGGGYAGGPVFTNGSISFAGVPGTTNGGTTGAAGWGAYLGIGSNASGDTTTNQGSLGLWLSSPSVGNPSLVFNLSSTGYSSLSLSFYGRLAGNAQSGVSMPIAWSYSTNGGSSYTSITTLAATGSPGSVTSYSFNLPAAVANLASFQLKGDFDFSAATGGNAGTSFVVDGVQLAGTAAVPEPQTWTVLGLSGILVLAGRKMRHALSRRRCAS